MFNEYKKMKYESLLDALTARLFWIICVLGLPLAIAYCKNIKIIDAFLEFITLVPIPIIIPRVCDFFSVRRKNKNSGIKGDVDECADNTVDFVVISAAGIYMVVKVYYYLNFTD